MKGIVFTELIEMVEAKWGLEVADTILDPTDLESQGVFTAVGTYADRDMQILVQRLGVATGLDGSTLLLEFGKYLFGTFARGYADMLERFDSTFGLLSHLDDFIHPEVQKLYPDASLPGFEVVSRDEKNIVLDYRSKRRMPEFAEGLIMAAAVHFKEKVEVKWEVGENEENLFRFHVEKLG